MLATEDAGDRDVSEVSSHRPQGDGENQSRNGAQGDGRKWPHDSASIVSHGACVAPILPLATFRVFGARLHATNRFATLSGPTKGAA